MSKKKGSTKTRISGRPGRSRHVIVISLVLTLLAAGAALAQWSGIVSLGQKHGKKSGEVSVQSFNPNSPSKEYIYAGSKLIATEEGTGGSSCSGTIIPMNASFSPSGGTGIVAVTAACSWTAVSDPNNLWITITSGASGTGNGQVNYSVAANSSSTSPRSGTMTIAQQTFQVTQSGSSCTYSINLTSKSFTAAGGSDSVTVTADAGCQWTAVSSDTTWLQITSGSSGTGSGLVNYSVGPNGPAQRTGTITIAEDRVFTVTQAGTGGGCTYSIIPANASFPNGAGSVLLQTQPGCTWTAVSYATGWLNVTSGSPGTGNGTVGYSVAANNTTKIRIGLITIANKLFKVTQGVGAGGGGGGTVRV